MKNTFFKSIAVLFVVLGLTSCEDFLSPDLADDLDPSAAFETIEDAEKVLFGGYASMRSATFIFNNAILSDNTRIGSGNRGSGIQTHSFTFTPDENFGWETRYAAIYTANDLIFNIDRISGAEVEEKNQLIGEALALRATAHLDLVRTFGNRYSAGTSSLGVPYRNGANNPEEEPSRNTLGEVYTNIIADLERAAELVSDEEAAMDISRVNRIAINALIARTKLEMGDYTGAFNAANAAINDPLAPPLAEGADYVSMFTLDTDSEVLWKLSNTGSIGSAFYEKGTGDNFFAPTDDLVALYDSTDIRTDVNFRFDAVAGEFTVNKYPGTSTLPDPPVDDFGRNTYKMIRLSEVYLIRAEAAFNMNGGGIDDLNAVRAARQASTGTEAGATLLSAIVTERRKELAFEGHRWFTLKRLGLDMNRGADCNASNCSLPADNNRWLAPIAQGEMNANANMVQNPGY